MNAYYMKRAINLAAMGTGFENLDPLSEAVIVIMSIKEMEQ